MICAYLAIEDLKDGKRIFTNIKFTDALMPKYHKLITYLTPEMTENLLEKLHNKEIDFADSAIYLQEIHSLMDSRLSMKKSNILMSYFLAQSRHAGNGKYFNIVGDTQHVGMIDVRFRRGIDVILYPHVSATEEVKINGKIENIPTEIECDVISFTAKNFNEGIAKFNVKGIYKLYNSWEIVDYNYKSFKEPVKNGRV